MRTLEIHFFSLPKAGNSAAEYEDAHFIGKWQAPSAAPATQQTARVGIAIADGATEGMLSRQWANLLVRRYVRRLPGERELPAWLSETLTAWQHEKRNYLRRRERNNKPVQWYEEPGLEAGAFAALLGFVLCPARGGRTSPVSPWTWNAFAVGDCFLAQVRGGECICMFPFNESSALNNRPFLLSSNPARNDGIAARFLFAQGETLPGDRFFLMTDSLAGWFLREYERGAAPWQHLANFRGASAAHAFAEWIAALRTAHALRNDDVTLLHFVIPDPK